MEYEFHVGDYVETIGGFVGWISAIRNDEYIVIVDKNNNTRGYYMPQESRYFSRIGQYDFTKKDAGKIEPLDYTERFIRNSPVDSTLISYMKKINELIKVVNDLGDKMDEHESD